MSEKEKGKKRQLSLTQMFAKKQKETDTSVTDFSESLNVGSNVAVPTSSTSAESQNKHLEISDAVVQIKEEEQPSKHNGLDIGHYIGKRNIPDNIKFELLTNCWKPSKTYNFPAVTELGKKRYFQLSWLEMFPWLAYSSVKEGAFCVKCVLFAKETAGKGAHQKLQTLVRTPLCKYKKALELLRGHQIESSFHNKQVEVDAENFIACYKNQGHNVLNKFNAGYNQMVEENRKRFIPIIKTVIFCGRQNIALRGTNDFGKLRDETSENDGNFRSLIRFRIDAGDTTLRSHLDTAPKNASYLSWRTQNEVISACGTYIMEQVAAEVRAAKFFSVLADETQDISKKDQFSVVLRFIKDNALCERFLTFVEVTDRTGKGLADTLLDTLVRCGIDISYLRGQGYDSCNAMSGQFKGVQAEVKKRCPLALYLPCSNHVFNLAVVHSCEIAYIRNALGTMKTICNFLSSSSARVSCLTNNVSEMLPEVSRKRVKPYCATRFIENHSGVITFKELLTPIVATLENLSTERSTSSSHASELLTATCKCEFIAALCVIETFASLLLPISAELQSPQLDIIEATEQIEYVVSILAGKRQNAIDEFHQLFLQVAKLCEELDVDIKLPRLVGRQLHRENTSHSTPEEYFRVNLYIPYVDMLSSELSALFSRHQNECLKLQHLIPKFISKVNFQDIQSTIRTYSSDLPSSESIARSEFERWKKKWENVDQGDKPKNAVETLETCSESFFPNIRTLLEIFAVLPVSTCSCERSFSCLRRLKTYLRSTMKEERLNGLAHLSINRHVNVNPEDIIEIFARCPRRLDFTL